MGLICINKLSLWIHVVFLSTRAFLVILVLSLHNNGLPQLILLTFAFVFTIMFKIIVRPYEKTLKNIQDVIGELLILTIALIYFSFLDSNLELATKGKGNTLGWTCISLIACIIGYFYVFMTIHMIHFCRIRKLRRKMISYVLENNRTKKKYLSQNRLVRPKEQRIEIKPKTNPPDNTIGHVYNSHLDMSINGLQNAIQEPGDATFKMMSMSRHLKLEMNDRNRSGLIEEEKVPVEDPERHQFDDSISNARPLVFSSLI